MIEMQNIVYQYSNNDRQVTVLDRFNLNIGDKEFVSLVGPSGCGKTTIVNILAGYIKPDSGTTLINKKILLSPAKDRIVISQENDLFEWMTVIENIKLVAKDKDPNSIQRYIRLVHLDGFENVYPAQLSGGMKKRLSLIRALSADPAFIIMDEPFSSLDVRIKEKLHEEVINIVKSAGKTVLLVTHDAEEAIFLSDRVVVLEGRPLEIKDQIQIPFSYPRHTVLKDTQEFIKLKNQVTLDKYTDLQ